MHSYMLQDTLHLRLPIKYIRRYVYVSIYRVVNYLHYICPQNIMLKLTF